MMRATTRVYFRSVLAEQRHNTQVGAHTFFFLFPVIKWYVFYEIKLWKISTVV